MDKNLKKLLIKTKKAVFSQQIGNNTSKFKGEGYDFVELREYEDGEDIRKIDWVISAKQQKPYVKVFHTQRELNINIVPILSGSIHFGTVKFKQELISEICAIVGFSCSAQGDSYSSYIANDMVSLSTKKTKKLYGVNKMIENIYNYNCVGKKVDYKTIQNQLYKQIKDKSIIFLIGDFFDIKNLNLNLLSKKHEVIAIIIRDKFEETPSKMGNVNFVDPTTNQKFNGNINNTLVKGYEKKVKLNDLKLYDIFRKSNIEFTKIYTHENPIVQLMKLFKK
ncbi:MAG: DUF58 domain-containing protein [Campylobacterota bacterium]|nr:DUF58 domain-containing protein [Campylobacterota bacterium]